MKSAYELAMEKLEKAQGPARKLTDEQRAALAEIDKKFDANAAAAKLENEQTLASAQSQKEYEAARRNLAATLAEIEADREAAKEAVWNEA